MTFYRDDWLTVYQGDCREVMRSMEPESVHCVVTSPPYWGLRDYGDAGQLGLEATPEEYVANLVDVFREVRRVLRNDGTVWLNLGDSYTSTAEGTVNAPQPKGSRENADQWARLRPRTGLKPKDLVGIPWRVAFALQADGWYLRSDIIWSKPNPMPESVTDRPTKSHEYLFLLSKSPRYYFDADAVRETSAPSSIARAGLHKAPSPKELEREAAGFQPGLSGDYGTGRNLRSVWEIATQPWRGAHFATFPRKLVEPCIKAGTSERGVCSICGVAWVRIAGREPADMAARYERGEPTRHGAAGAAASSASNVGAYSGVRTFVGWKAGCPHRVSDGAEIIPATVLDPFAGSGTTGAVAQSLNRRAVLIDLNGDYLTQAMGRNRDIPLGLDAA